MPSFATSINCIDGRVQSPVSEWIKKNHHVDFVDMLSEPGCDLRLVDSSDIQQRLKSHVAVSIRAHGSKLLFVSGHHQCAANPVSKTEHIEHIKKSIDTVAGWNLGVLIMGLWVNDSWNVEIVGTSGDW